MKELETVKYDDTRQRKAAMLRTYGWSYHDIACELGYPDELAVAVAVRESLQLHEMHSVAEGIAQEDVRLHTLLRAWTPAALSGDKDAANVVLKVHTALVKLHGLAQPTKVALSRQADEAFAEDIDSLLRDLSVPTYIEPTADADEDWAELPE
ncbi:hypothetical protein AB0J47_31325 [Nocardia sp. NPDC049737]|uniref:hypothetical protein n=1 Tax=Nocardia sp. NPDC049737 TaxID=3154358 RepID=UPI003445DCE8